MGGQRAGEVRLEGWIAKGLAFWKHTVVPSHSYIYMSGPVRARSKSMPSVSSDFDDFVRDRLLKMWTPRSRAPKSSSTASHHSRSSENVSHLHLHTPPSSNFTVSSSPLVIITIYVIAASLDPHVQIGTVYVIMQSRCTAARRRIRSESTRSRCCPSPFLQPSTSYVAGRSFMNKTFIVLTHLSLRTASTRITHAQLCI